MDDKTQMDKAVSLAAAIMGRKGGLARVAKGTSMATPEQRVAWGKKGMAKRWGSSADAALATLGDATASLHIAPAPDAEKIIEEKA